MSGAAFFGRELTSITRMPYAFWYSNSVADATHTISAIICIKRLMRNTVTPPPTLITLLSKNFINDQ